MAILTSTIRVRLGRRPKQVELAPQRPVPVSDELIDALLDGGNGVGRKLVEAGVLRVSRDAPMRRVTEPTAFAPPPDLADLSIAKAAPLIAEEADLDRLARWRANDERSGMHALIDKRVEALLAPRED